MRRQLLTLALVTLFSQFSTGQSLKKEYQAGIIKLIDCLKSNRKEQLADWVAYPLGREYPLPPVKNKKEFLARFDEIFDDTLKRLIVQSKPATDWSEVGWRGIMLHQGVVWVDQEGTITAINYQSQAEVARKKQLIEADKKKLHSSLASFKAPLYVLETKKFRIRIDELSEGRYRYASWPLTKSMGEKPDLVLTNGEWFFEGSGGNHRIEFKNAGYLYVCSIIELGSVDSPDAVLTIYKGGKEILSQDAQLVQGHK
jgi:hypothetical protein